MAFPISEHNTHSFIIKIWTDQPTVATNDTIWHGQATNVVTGELFLFENLEKLEQFLRETLSDVYQR